MPAYYTQKHTPSINQLYNTQLSYGKETARSLIHFRLISSVIRKIMHKMGFLGHSVTRRRVQWHFLALRKFQGPYWGQDVRNEAKTDRSVAKEQLVFFQHHAHLQHIQNFFKSNNRLVDERPWQITFWLPIVYAFQPFKVIDFCANQKTIYRVAQKK